MKKIYSILMFLATMTFLTMACGGDEGVLGCSRRR